VKFSGKSKIQFVLLLFKIVGLHLGAESCKAVGCSNDQLWPSQLYIFSSIPNIESLDTVLSTIGSYFCSISYLA
jgi:hypothetical protein